MTDTNPRLGPDPGLGSDPDLDAGPELDLTPRVPLRSPGQTARRRSYRNIVVLSVLAAVLGFVLYQALTSARVYFLNVDEAVAQRDDLGRQNFRMQGELVAVNGTDPNGALLFTLAFADQSADVRHVGDEPSDLFELGEKIVVDGYWDGPEFLSNQILVKHSEEYVEDNPDRLTYEVDYDNGDVTGAAGDPAADEASGG